MNGDPNQPDDPQAPGPGAPAPVKPAAPAATGIDWSGVANGSNPTGAQKATGAGIDWHAVAAGGDGKASTAAPDPSKDPASPFYVPPAAPAPKVDMQTSALGTAYGDAAAAGNAIKAGYNSTARAANNLVGGAATSALDIPAHLAALPGLKQINAHDPTAHLVGPLYRRVRDVAAPPDPGSAVAQMGAGLEQAGELAAVGPEQLGADALAEGAARISGRVAGNAAIAGGDAAMHGQNPRTAAALGAGGAALAEVAPSVANRLRQAAQTQYSRFLNPTTNANKYMAAKVIPELLDRGVVTTSGQSLEDMAANRADATGEQIGKAVGAIPPSATISTSPILKELDNYKNEFIVNGVPVNQQAVNAATDLQDTVKAIGPDVSYESLNKARQILDKSVSAAKGYQGASIAEGSVLDAQRAAANAMRRVLANDQPDIAKLNAEYHLWSQVQDVIRATNARRIGQNGLQRVLGYPLTAGAGLAVGGARGAGEGAAVMALAEAVQSPLWRTASAVTKNEIAEALASNNSGKLLRSLGRLGAAGIGTFGQKGARNQ